MREKLLRQTIERVGPKGTETGGPGGIEEAGKDLLGVVDAYRRNDRAALERHLRSAATFAALQLLDRRVGSGRTGGAAATAGSDDVSLTDIEITSGDGSEADAGTGGGSGLFTLPRLALVAAVAAVGYLLVNRHRSEESLTSGDSLLDGDEDGRRAATDDTAANVDVDTPAVTTEAVEGEAEANIVADRGTADDEDAADDDDSAADGATGSVGSDDEPGDDIGDEVETVDDLSGVEAEPGEIVAEEEVVEEATGDDDGDEATGDDEPDEDDGYRGDGEDGQDEDDGGEDGNDSK